MITFYLSEAFRLFRKSGYNSFVLIFVTSLAALVSVASVFIVYGVNKLDNDLKAGIKLNVFIQSNKSQVEIEQLKLSLQRMSVVKKVEFIDKNYAKEKFIKDTGEDFKQVLDENPLPNSFIVSLDATKVNEAQLDRITGNIKTLDGVEDIVYDYDTTFKLLKLLRMIQYFFYPLAVILIALSIYLVYSNNKLQIKQNHNLFNTMNLVGGNPSSIRIPIIINGFFIGIVSSLLCIGAITLTLTLLTATLNSFKFTAYIITVNIFISIINISLGLIGSILSSRNFLPETKF